MLEIGQTLILTAKNCALNLVSTLAPETQGDFLIKTVQPQNTEVGSFNFLIRQILDHTDCTYQSTCGPPVEGVKVVDGSLGGEKGVW